MNGIFGWAVIALFGSTSPKEETMLSVVVAAAAAWPILLLGVIVPKIALLVIAFVPLSKSVPGFWLRLTWIALAVAVPIAVGTVVAKRGSRDAMPEPGWKRFLRGFSVTLALACAFLLMVVVAPILRIVTVIRRREGVRIPSVMDKTITAPTMVALAEALQRIRLEQPRAHARSDILEGRGIELSAHLSRLNLPWDEWQIIYRLLLQLDRGCAETSRCSSEHNDWRRATWRRRSLRCPRRATWRSCRQGRRRCPFQ